MNKSLKVSAAAILALAVAVPAFAGGAHCSKESATTAATTADAKESCCAGKSVTTAWSGAWLQRSSTGAVTVAEVAKGSPAARSGIKGGDIVVAVNGYNLSDSKDRAMCASKADCNVGSAVTYTVQRGRSTKDFKVKLTKMPSDVTARFASRQAKFDPSLAAVVLAVNE